MVLENPGKCVRGELTPLVGVEYLGSPVAAERLFKSLDTKGDVQGIGKFPGKNLTACPVHNRHKVAESLCHGDIRDVRGPNGIAFGDRKSSQ